jgi:hypothetical protein
MRPWLPCLVLLAAALTATGDLRADDGFQAETGFDFWGADDAQRVTGSVRWYPNAGDPWLVQLGARLGGERLQFDGADVTPATLGGFVGLSHAVGRIWPTVTLGLDHPFRGGDLVDREITGTVGARWFLTDRGSSSYALHLGGFRTEWQGAGDQPNRTGYGLFAGVHQSRLSPAAWGRLGPEGVRNEAGLVGGEVELLAAGAPGDFWAGLAIDRFRREGRTDVGLGLERVCLDDPTNDLTACGWVGALRGEWHLGRRSGGAFAERWVPLVGLAAGALAGPAHTYYDYQGSLWAGVRWQPDVWPLSIHVAAVGRHLVARDGFDDRTVGGVQVALSFR